MNKTYEENTKAKNITKQSSLLLLCSNGAKRGVLEKLHISSFWKFPRAKLKKSNWDKIPSSSFLSCKKENEKRAVH